MFLYLISHFDYNFVVFIFVKLYYMFRKIKYDTYDAHPSIKTRQFILTLVSMIHIYTLIHFGALILIAPLVLVSIINIGELGKLCYCSVENDVIAKLIITFLIIFHTSGLGVIVADYYRYLDLSFTSIVICVIIGSYLIIKNILYASVPSTRKIIKRMEFF